MRAMEWTAGKLRILDQRKLPAKISWLTCKTVSNVINAIKTMAVRGAPAIGVAAAYGMALSRDPDKDGVRLKRTRPTAVDLSNAIEYMLKKIESGDDALSAAKEWDRNNSEKCKDISISGAKLIKSRDQILTHCNTGFLATNEYGTALGAIKQAHKQKKKILVYVDETRPRFQGALTSWELLREKVPHKVIVDSAAGFLMRAGEINAVMVGADRIAANGDFANKIGTYSLAVLAKENRIPFYVLAPLSSFDLKAKNERDIKIEIRDESEILRIKKKLYAKTRALNLAFDITPSRYVTAYVCELGIFKGIDELWKSMKG